jgi:hypothetical protein
MRQLSEINKDTEEIDSKIKALRAQREILSSERRERIFADFCEKYGVKKGDVVHTERYGDMMVCGIDTRWGDWVQIRKIKKDGQPYCVTNTQSQCVFEGCKVIGHIEEDKQ